MRLAEFAWRSPPPSSVDERLVLTDDAAWLLVVAPVRDDGAVGVFRAEVPPEERAVLAAAGPGPHVFDVLAPAGGSPGGSSGGPSGDADLRAAAQRVAELAHGQPVAVAQFGAAGIIRAGAAPIVSLTVTGVGAESVSFHLDPGRITVQFAADDQALDWQPAPAPGMGFMTPDADLLGGVGLGANVAPDDFGAIALGVAPPPTATRVSVSLTGTLHANFAGSHEDAPFRVRTPWAPVSRKGG